MTNSRDNFGFYPYDFTGYPAQAGFYMPNFLGTLPPLPATPGLSFFSSAQPSILQASLEISPEQSIEHFILALKAKAFPTAIEIWIKNSNMLLNLPINKQMDILDVLLSIEPDSDVAGYFFANQYLECFDLTKNMDYVNRNLQKGNIENFKQFLTQKIEHSHRKECQFFLAKQLHFIENISYKDMQILRDKMNNQELDVSLFWDEKTNIHEAFFGKGISDSNLLENFKAALNWHVEMNPFIRVIWDRNIDSLIFHIESLSDKKQLTILNLVLKISTGDLKFIAEYIDKVNNLVILKKSEKTNNPQIDALIEKRKSYLESIHLTTNVSEEFFDELSELSESKIENTVDFAHDYMKELFPSTWVEGFEQVINTRNQSEILRNWNKADDIHKRYFSGMEIEIFLNKYQIKISNCLQHFEDMIHNQCFEIAQFILDHNGVMLGQHIATLDLDTQSNLLTMVLFNKDQLNLILVYLQTVNNAKFLKNYLINSEFDTIPLPFNIKLLVKNRMDNINGNTQATHDKLDSQVSTQFDAPIFPMPMNHEHMIDQFMLALRTQAFPIVWQIWNSSSDTLINLPVIKQVEILKIIFSFDSMSNGNESEFVNAYLSRFDLTKRYNDKRSLIHKSDIVYLRNALIEEYKKHPGLAMFFKKQLGALEDLLSPESWMETLRRVMNTQVGAITYHWGNNRDFHDAFYGKGISIYLCVENFKAVLNWRGKENTFIQKMWNQNKDALIQYIKELSDKKQLSILNSVLNISTGDILFIFEYINTIDNPVILKKSKKTTNPDIDSFIKKRIVDLENMIQAKEVKEESDFLPGFMSESPEIWLEQFSMIMDTCQCKFIQNEWDKVNGINKKYFSGVAVVIADKKYQIKISNCLQHFEDAIYNRCYQMAKTILQENGNALGNYIATRAPEVQSDILKMVLNNHTQTRFIESYLETVNNIEFLNRSLNQSSTAVKNLLERRIDAINSQFQTESYPAAQNSQFQTQSYPTAQMCFTSFTNTSFKKKQDEPKKICQPLSEEEKKKKKEQAKKHYYQSQKSHDGKWIYWKLREEEDREVDKNLYPLIKKGKCINEGMLGDDIVVTYSRCRFLKFKGKLPNPKPASAGVSQGGVFSHTLVPDMPDVSQGLSFSNKRAKK